MPKNAQWQKTVDITPFVDRIEDAIATLAHDNGQDFETLAYRIGTELVRRHTAIQLQIQIAKMGASTSTRG